MSKFLVVSRGKIDNIFADDVVIGPQGVLAFYDEKMGTKQIICMYGAGAWEYVTVETMPDFPQISVVEEDV